MALEKGRRTVVNHVLPPREFILLAIEPSKAKKSSLERIRRTKGDTASGDPKKAYTASRYPKVDPRTRGTGLGTPGGGFR